MKSSLHLLVGSAAFYGATKIYGQNLLLPAQAGVPLQFAAVLYAAHELHTEAPAVALVIKTVFYRPMMPWIAPSSLMWDYIVYPHIHALVTMMHHQGHNPRGSRLGGVASSVAAMLKNQPSLLDGDGVLIVPQVPSPVKAMPWIAPPRPSVAPAFPAARRSTLRLAA